MINALIVVGNMWKIIFCLVSVVLDECNAKLLNFINVTYLQPD